MSPVGHGGCLLFPSTWTPNTLINVMTATLSRRAVAQLRIG